MYAVSPLLVVVGGITFHFERRVFGLVSSQRLIDPTASTMRREDEKKSEPRYLGYLRLYDVSNY
jgi:hypothetical protein